MTAEDGRPVRLAELIAALSLATDIGMGQPMEQALNTCLLAVRCGASLGLPQAALSDVYYLALLRFIGCTADAHEAAVAVGGDEISDRAALATVLMGEQPELMGYMFHHYAEGQSALKRLRLILAAFADGTRGAKRVIAEHCEVAQMLVSRMGIHKEVGVYVGCVFERWDGKGLPGLLAGDAIPAPARIVAIARDVEVFSRLAGWPLTAAVLQRRRGKAYDPAAAQVFLDQGERWLGELAQQAAWDAVVTAEPAPHATVADPGLDEVLHAFADFADLKSPFTLRHSSEVATLAGTAARAMGLNDEDAKQAERSGLVHDLGKTGVPNGIWDKPGPLSNAEWERVRLHPYLTERILSYSAPLRGLASIAGTHHERLDGSGYHRGSVASALLPVARVLAAADAYQAMGQARPYRPALDRPAQERELLRQATDGKLDRDAVQAVLSVAGHEARVSRRAWPSGLTDRESEVLRLLSLGHSKPSVAKELTISTKTVGRHVENIYGKIGVSSRAAAALFASQHELI